MNQLIVVLSVLVLSSCTAVSVSNGKVVVTAEKDKPFCDTKKVDPNCKIESTTK